MSYFTVLWLSFACPGGWFSGMVPEAARPYVCRVQPETDVYGSREEAERKLMSLGPSAHPRLFVWTNLRKKEVPLTWLTTLTVGN